MSLIPRAGQILTAGHALAVANWTVSYWTPGAAYTSTSSTYAVVNSGGNFTLVKVDSASALRIDMHIGCWSQTSTCTGEFGLQFGSSSYQSTVIRAPQSVATTHRNFSGHTVMSGVPAGSQTVSIIFRRIVGTGTLTVDTNDRVSVAICEVQE